MPKGHHLSKFEKEIIYSVFKYFDNEKHLNKKSGIQHAAEASGLSEAAIRGVIKEAEKNNDDTAVKIQFSVQELPKTDSVNTPVSVEWLQEQVKSAQSFISVEKKDSSLPSSSSSFQSEFEKQFLHQTSQISSQSSANIFSDDSQSSSVFSSPKKKHRKRTTTDLDLNQCSIIRNVLYNFHTSHQKLPTLAGLTAELSLEHNIVLSLMSLSRVLTNMGFKFRKSMNNREVLADKENIRKLRHNYITRVRQYREEGRPIVYVDETYVHTTYSKNRQWHDQTIGGFETSISRGSRYIIVHAGWENGFIPGALNVFKSGNKTEDYHGEMNAENYSKWVATQLVPNLPSRSVIVVDNASYHSKNVDLPPNSNTKKDVIQEWLSKKGIGT